MQLEISFQHGIQQQCETFQDKIIELNFNFCYATQRYELDIKFKFHKKKYHFRLVSCHDEVHIIMCRQDMTPIMLASRGAGGLAGGAGGSLGKEGQ